MRAEAIIQKGSGPYPWELWVRCEDLRNGEPGKEERRVQLYSRHELRKHVSRLRGDDLRRAENALRAHLDLGTLVADVGNVQAA